MSTARRTSRWPASSATRASNSPGQATARALSILSRGPRPRTTLAILGECHIAVGKLVQGAEELTRVVRENIDPQAPASFRTAQDRARVHLDEVRPGIPKLRPVVFGTTANVALSIR